MSWEENIANLLVISTANVVFMKKSVPFLLLFCLLPVFPLCASAPAKTVVTYMDPDNPHQVVLYNNSEGKTILVVDRLEYPDGAGSYTDTLLLDDESRIIRIASLGIYNGKKVYSDPTIIEQPTIYWSLDDVVNMPSFKWTDYETIDPDEQGLFGDYEKLRNRMLLSGSEKALLDVKGGSWFTWIGFGLMLLGILAAIATLTLKLSSKSIRFIGGYVAALSMWCGMYPVWSFLNEHFEMHYGITFVVLSTILIAVYSNVIMNRVEADRSLTNKQVKSSFVPAFFVSIAVCIVIGYQYVWWGAFFGYLLAMLSNLLTISRPNRCEKCRRKQTLKEYDELIIGKRVYETSDVKGSPDVYRIYRKETCEVYVKRFRCSACGHIQEDSQEQERTIESKVVRREYLYTKKQRPTPRASVSTSNAFPKVYEVMVGGHQYTLTQQSKYSDTDYSDQYGGCWYKGANGFEMRERGLHDTHGR